MISCACSRTSCAMSASGAPGASERYSRNKGAASSGRCNCIKVNASSRRSGSEKGSVARRYLPHKQAAFVDSCVHNKPQHSTLAHLSSNSLQVIIERVIPPQLACCVNHSFSNHPFLHMAAQLLLVMNRSSQAPALIIRAMPLESLVAAAAASLSHSSICQGRHNKQCHMFVAAPAAEITMIRVHTYC